MYMRSPSDEKNKSSGDESCDDTLKVWLNVALVMSHATDKSYSWTESDELPTKNIFVPSGLKNTPSGTVSLAATLSVSTCDSVLVSHADDMLYSSILSVASPAIYRRVPSDLK